MTRGRFVLVRTDADGERHIHVSTEFNGGMGANELADVLFSYDSGMIHDVKEWEAFIERFNQEHHQYSDVVLYEDLAEYPEVNPCELVTSYVGRSDYSYWLNLADENVEVLTKEGVVLIPSMEGAVFDHKVFYKTGWKAHPISAKKSKEFRFKAQAYEKLKEGLLTKKDVQEWLTYIGNDSVEIISVYSSVEELGEDRFFNHLSLYGLSRDDAQRVVDDIGDYMDYRRYGEPLVSQYGYVELSSGKILEYEEAYEEADFTLSPENDFKEARPESNLSEEDLLSVTYILCYEENGKQVWEEILGEDAMEIRVDELMEELNLDADDIQVFAKNTQL